jgi:probable O-glycosylation ligase (exosortase A-associated)
MRDLPLAVILLVLAAVGFTRPFLGLLGWTWVTYFSPTQFTWGWSRSIPGGEAVAIPTLVGLLFTPERRLPPITRETLLLITLWLWFGVTTLNVLHSPLLAHHYVETLGQMLQVSKTLLMTFVALMLLIDKNKLRWWYLVTVACFIVLCVKDVTWVALTGGEFQIYGPGRSMIADNNDFALAVNICLPMIYYLAKTEASRPIRLALWASLPFAALAVVLTYSRGGLLGLLAVMLAIALQSKHKIRGLSLILGLALLAFLVAPGKWIERMETIRTAAQSDPSARSRFFAWKFSTLVAFDHPVLGGGFETFTGEMYDRYGMGGHEIVHGPHSIYFQMLAEHGFPGLAIFLAILISCLLTCQRIKRRCRRADPNSWLIPYCSMVIASLCAYATSGAFLGRAYFVMFYQLVATTILLTAFARAEMAAARRDEAAVELELPVLHPTTLSV